MRGTAIGRAARWALLLAAAAAPGTAQPRKPPAVFGIFDGDPMYTVLPPGAIPAIEAPRFVTGKDAEAQMLPDEPVLGVVVGGEAHAYSLWHLDAHEIVNDAAGNTLFAASW
ncbi:MAG: DUF3179 domain-containing protein [Acidobacteria bacterium]|nr:MAG: DUF3179 domain-containing protein [Acidobacteriota bacterium]